MNAFERTTIALSLFRNLDKLEGKMYSKDKCVGRRLRHCLFARLPVAPTLGAASVHAVSPRCADCFFTEEYSSSPWQPSFTLVNLNNRVSRSRKRLALLTRIPSFFFTQEKILSDRKDQGSCQRTPNSAACLAEGRGSTTNLRRARRWRSSTSSWTFTRSSMSCRAERSSSMSRPSTGEHFLFLHFFFYFYASSRLKDINNGRSESISPQRRVEFFKAVYYSKMELLLQKGLKGCQIKKTVATDNIFLLLLYIAVLITENKILLI